MSPSAKGPWAGKTTGGGTAIPATASGSVNINAILQAMVSRDIWTYYYTLKLASGTTFAPSYGLFNQYVSQQDPYPLAAASPNPTLTKVETNMPSQSGQGFTAPRDLILNRIGFYFLPGASGNNSVTEGIGLQSNVNDMFAFCQYSYFEFKIIEKIFIEGYLELQPPGVGFSGFSTVANTNIVTLGMTNPHATNKMGDFAKYLAPQMPWSLTIYFPSSSGPIANGTTAGAAGALLTSSNGGHGLWLKTNLTGLTDRAVQ
jgi:hypothetical protein